MLRPPHAVVLALAAGAALAAGCNLAGPNRRYDAELAHYKELAQTVDRPELTTPPGEHAFTPPPRTIDEGAVPQEWWSLSLDEAIQIAVARSSVLRDLGGTVVRSPDTARTILGPSQVSSDPRFGIEAALSEFDATLASSVIAEKNDRMVNNFIAANTQERILQQDLINFQTQISKLTASGTRLTLRGVSIYDHNNASFNTFPSTWDSLLEAEVRVPLWQGAGTRFNRLAGPNSVPGFYNGVLIARVNTDISVAEFEIGLRDLVNDVENAYWDLYFAYRDLDARIRARDAALESWKRIQILLLQDQAGGLLEREAQAREQYFRYEEEVQNSLSGRQQDLIALITGTSTGSFRGAGGVLVNERRLRLAMGLPITDGRMIRPADEPTLAQVRFDWMSATADAVSRRPELLRQRLAVKRREMELVAARNFLLPRLDVLGRYRYRGMGQNLIGEPDFVPPPLDPGGPFGRGSIENMFSGDFQEWQLGAEVSQPIGYRRGWSAVRNAQLNLAREKAVLEEQERQVVHDLSNAFSDLDRSYRLMETSYNRRLAAQQHVDILRFQMAQEQPVGPEQLLEAERRLADADIQFHRTLVEHMLAIKNIHFEKGTLLEYGHIFLTERLTLTPASAPRPPVEPGQMLVAQSNEPATSQAEQQPTPAGLPPAASPPPAEPPPSTAPAPTVPAQTVPHDHPPSPPSRDMYARPPAHEPPQAAPHGPENAHVQPHGPAHEMASLPQRTDHSVLVPRDLPPWPPAQPHPPPPANGRQPYSPPPPAVTPAPAPAPAAPPPAAPPLSRATPFIPPTATLAPPIERAAFVPESAPAVPAVSPIQSSAPPQPQGTVVWSWHRTETEPAPPQSVRLPPSSTRLPPSATPLPPATERLPAP